MKVAVVGLGTFGKSLAISLARAGVEVMAVDRDPDLVAEVKDEVGWAVRMDATDEKEFKAQGLASAGALVACIGEDFEANQLVALLARNQGIKRVLARAKSRTHARILKLMGVDEVILPEEKAAQDTVFLLLEPSLKSYLNMIEGVAVMELAAPEAFEGKTVGEIDLRRRFKVNLLLIRCGAEHGKTEIIPVPGASDPIQHGDVLVVSGREPDVRKLAKVRL